MLSCHLLMIFHGSMHDLHVSLAFFFFLFKLQNPCHCPFGEVDRVLGYTFMPSANNFTCFYVACSSQDPCHCCFDEEELLGLWDLLSCHLLVISRGFICDLHVCKLQNPCFCCFDEEALLQFLGLWSSITDLKCFSPIHVIYLDWHVSLSILFNVFV